MYQYELLYKGRVVERTDDESRLYAYIHKHTSYSLSHAVQYEGYEVFKDGVNISENYILKSHK